jgi:tripeptide aminopeptidase
MPCCDGLKPESKSGRIAPLLASLNMQIELLQQMLTIPSPSRREERMVAFLNEHVLRRGVKRCGQMVEDQWNNVYIRKGKPGIVPCVAAHIDTVQSMYPVEIVQQGGALFGLDESGQRTGIGADDKAGVFICLELLERFDDLTVMLFAGEEIGCLGAQNAPEDWFKDVGYVIEFDCPGRGLVSYTSNGVRLFANNGQFIQRAFPVLEQHGLTKWQRHPFTDVMALRRRFDFSCLNLSCGYHQWHQPDEYIVLDEVGAALTGGEDLLRALGRHRYTFDSGGADTPLAPLEVTGFQMA